VRTVFFIAIAASSRTPLTVATAPSRDARTVTLKANGCIDESGAKVTAGAPPSTCAKPPAGPELSLAPTGAGLPCSSASNSVGTNVRSSSSWPAAFGCSESCQKPFAHFPVPSSTAPRKLTLGTSHALIARFIRRVYSYSTDVKSLRV
jgi:hypothetical protein